MTIEFAILCFIGLLMLVFYSIKNTELSLMNANLKERINKAIEYIETVEPNYNSLHSEILQSEYISNYGACELLEILKGSDKETSE